MVVRIEEFIFVQDEIPVWSKKCGLNAHYIKKKVKLLMFEADDVKNFRNAIIEKKFYYQ